MEPVDRPAPLDAEQAGDTVAHLCLGLGERGVVGGQRRLAQHRRQVVADRGRQDEVAVGQTLHQRAGTEPVRAVVGEVGLAEHVETGHVAHEVVVDPEAAHRVVDRRVDPHGQPVRVFPGDPLVHLEEVAVPLFDHGPAEA